LVGICCLILAEFMQISLICPCKIGLPSVRPILDLKNMVRCRDNGLVSKSASWSWVWTCLTWIEPFWTKSCTKCRSIWICFILEWWTELKLRWVALRLSHSREGGALSGKPSSSKRLSNHIVSDAALAKDLYSASVDERATARCFFEL